MIDIQARRFNERLKAVSSLLSNGGLAVAAASVARWYGSGLDRWVIVWVSVAAILVIVAVELLRLLQMDED